MKKRFIVLSLGGSLIVPEKIDLKFLKEFKRVILKNTKKHKFIIVCGGGSVARKYINALRKLGLNEEFQSFSGISATRTNARFMSYIFKINPKQGIPHTLKKVESDIREQDVVFCGALEYRPKQTSDSTSAELAKHFKTDFINLTNVSGLYNRNPLKYKNAKFIPKISWRNFFEMTHRGKFKPGQHFVLDQTASAIILKNEIITYILGKDLKQLDNLLNNRKFKGTVISG